MTSYVYPSAFSHGPASVAAASTNTGTDTTSDGPVIFTPQTSNQVGHLASGQGLASFICHVAYLDDKLQRGDRSAFFAAHRGRVVSRKRVGNGASFIVERAELETIHASSDAAESSQTEIKAVAVKTVREDRHHPNQWGEVLLEIRALLHEPIRYHPNIVKLLDIRWDASIDTGSKFPVVVQEYASFGTLDKLQRRSKPLPFSIKQKLCYDVGRALSIIHSCGMVHGDLKHENVLIFPNPYSDAPNQPYTAKLADFGGTVMDFSNDNHRIPMHTFPYDAPEVFDRLTEEGAKKTDAYSYGMLIWRCMIDSQDVLQALGVARSSQGGVDTELENKIKLLKLSDGLLEAAIHSIANYFFVHKLPAASLNLITSALMFTLRGDPKQRALDRAQVRMRGMDSVAAYHYVGIKEEANKKTIENQRYRTPGRHGMDLDSVGFALGRMGNDYDAQNNLPGFRPDLPRPERGGFLFEPLNLRSLLDWGQQEAMIQDFERFANAESNSPDNTTGGMTPEPYTAAYFLFQSYLCGFGVAFDATKACYWLRRAAEPKEEMGETDYYALAWFNRVHAALGVPNPYDVDKQIDNLWWSTIRGHKHCDADAEAVIDASTNFTQKQAWRRKMEQADMINRSMTGSTGMPFFAPRKLTRSWDLDDLNALDGQIRDELGREYDSSLRPPVGSEEESDPAPDNGYRFDKIYVNHKGHGLLHMAAVEGNLSALKHLHQKYLCDINLKNQSHGDTALICACLTGRYEMALWLIDNGADPNGGQFCEESPLHCVTSFSKSEMDMLVTKLVAAGADIEKHSEASRKDVRGILADWEDTAAMTLTPLGRAVLKQSRAAVKILLKHGASPTAKKVDRNRANQSPVELAAVLTLPDILEELLGHTDDAVPVFDECGMLDAALSREITSFNPLSLHSRLVRCGVQYKENMQRTLRILHERSQKQKDRVEHPPGKHLCNQILLGNTDIVAALLSLGHDPTGSPSFRPLLTAVKANHAAIFDLLVSNDPPPITSPDDPSILHTLATRFPHAPRDPTIAQYLLAYGSPADTVTENEVSPLVLAIRNGHYDLADLLVSHGAGASLSTLNTTLSSSSSETLLGTLIQTQTSASLGAISYLSHLHNRSRISPLASRTLSGVEYSVIHLLAEVPHSEWNSHNQISASIIQILLHMYPDPDSLGEVAVNPVTGSVVSAAVVSSHVELLRALVGTRGYGAACSQKVSLLNTERAMTPEALARKVAVERLAKLASKEEVTEAEVDGLSRAMEVVTVLEVLETEEGLVGDNESGDTKEEDGKVREMWKTVEWEGIITALEAKVKPDFVEPQINRDGAEVNLPADLSVLTDERPTGWREGVEMTSEMSLRIFLKHFRKDNEMLGEGIIKAMSKMFNKRNDGDDEGRGEK